MERENLLYNDLSYKIIGTAMEVHGVLGCGFLEGVYEEAFCYELKLREIKFERQKEIGIYYKDFLLPKKYICDLIVEDKILVELKAKSSLDNVDDAQLINYLKATKFKLGLLFNFGSASLEYKRKVLEKLNP